MATSRIRLVADPLIVFRDAPRLILAERARDRLVLSGAGATRLVLRQEGSPGPAGPAGAALDFTYDQTTPAQTWTVNHNLGVRPIVSVLTPGGVEVEAAVTHISTNQLQLDFAAPQAGRVRCV